MIDGIVLIEKVNDGRGKKSNTNGRERGQLCQPHHNIIHPPTTLCYVGPRKEVLLFENHCLARHICSNVVGLYMRHALHIYIHATYINAWNEVPHVSLVGLGHTSHLTWAVVGTYPHLRVSNLRLSYVGPDLHM